MAHVHRILLIAQIILYASAAPSDVSNLEDIAKVETADSKLDLPVTLVGVRKTVDDAQGTRRKRQFYDYYGFGFPPMNPIAYPNYPNLRDQNLFGPEDPYSLIFKRLQDIAGVIRRPAFNQPPLPPPVPVLFPVVYIPQVGCRCTPNQPPRRNGTSNDPGVSNRFPDMEDERQNWGFVVNPGDRVEDDFTRPISFVPITPITTPRPAPPLEHGSSSGAGQDGTTTTSRPGQNPPAAAAPAPSIPPSNCDGAILTCCHQPQATYDCFVAQGCADPTSYGNPCDSQVILNVIEKFARFYGRNRNS